MSTLKLERLVILKMPWSHSTGIDDSPCAIWPLNVTHARRLYFIAYSRHFSYNNIEGIFQFQTREVREVRQSNDRQVKTQLTIDTESITSISQLFRSSASSLYLLRCTFLCRCC